MTVLDVLTVTTTWCKSVSVIPVVDSAWVPLPFSSNRIFDEVFKASCQPAFAENIAYCVDGLEPVLLTIQADMVNG